MRATTQRHLETALHHLFPESKILKNVRRSAAIVDPSTNQYVELDFWIPELKMAFEFQDAHHYTTSFQCRTHSLDFIKRRDNIKRLLVETKGETLICIPHWWDGEISSLVTTIHERLPHLFEQMLPREDMINIIPSFNIFYGVRREIPGIRELMLATPTASFDDFRKGWMDENYDGIQVMWHPETRKLYSKTGNDVSFLQITARYQEVMPTDLCVDGTIWFGRDTSTTNEAYMRFIAVDSPGPPSTTSLPLLPFELRFASLLQSIPPTNPTFIPGVNVEWPGNIKLMKYFDQMKEPPSWCDRSFLLLRRKASFYSPGRSSDLYKIKIADLSVRMDRREDEEMERRVRGYWTVNASENIRQFFDQFAQKRGFDPLFAKNWYSITRDDICSHQGGASVMRVYGHSLRRALLDTYPTIGLCADHFHPSKHGIYLRSTQSRKSFFDTFGASNGFDPLIPSRWHDVTLARIIDTKAGISIMNYYGHSLVRALRDVYPHLSFDPSCFNKPRNYWQHETHKRSLLDSFASCHGFSPSISSNWANIPKAALIKFKGVRSVLQQHNGSIWQTLSTIYPDVTFDRREFIS